MIGTTFHQIAGRWRMRTGNIQHPWTFASEDAARQWYSSGGWQACDVEYLRSLKPTHWLETV